MCAGEVRGKAAAYCEIKMKFQCAICGSGRSAKIGPAVRAVASGSISRRGGPVDSLLLKTKQIGPRLKKMDPIFESVDF